ncbi:MAG: HAMP domain-containing protein [Candidatus Aminicenantes bacterium]|nr:HAMP domain-containing protein [Candidatus Aminicenantes bacterium]
MKRSIFSKIFGGYLVISLVVTALILLFSLSAVRSFHLDSLARGLESLGSALKYQVVPLISAGDYPKLDSFLKEFGNKIETRITVIDREGAVLADSDEDPKNMDNHGFRQEIMTAYSKGIGRSLRYSGTVKEYMLYVALPIENEGRVTHVLRTSLYVRDIDYLLANLRKNIMLFGAIIIAISLVGALLFSRSIASPIQELNAASRRIASGDFNTKVFLKKKNEFKDLADSFNFMTDHIKALFDELSRKKEQVNSILLSIQEGLIALDKDGRIFMTNESFKKITSTQVSEGKLYWEVIRDPALSELFKRVKTHKRNYSEEIELNDRIFLVNTAFLHYTGEIVATFHDITEIRNIERIKKELVLNVSHELRTPLTAIKGFVETLEEATASKKYKNYLEIIKKNTDRLIRIVNDLLVQSELEEKYLQLEVEEIDLKTMLENISKIFEHKLGEKGLSFTLNATENFPDTIKGDSFKLEQLFVNILDNAVKYTEAGRISVNLEKRDKDICITIEDTGIGIPKKDLFRVFERFYVVDRSRSRRLGGTGLGLSIVKHIVLLHGGEVSVESTQGIGTKVVVKLPA